MYLGGKKSGKIYGNVFQRSYLAAIQLINNTRDSKTLKFKIVEAFE
jgi:hypothetical protein